ncbi:DEAD/DEAH box helicase [Cryomorpha ignava]|uniref:DEAD-box ATP-dependent RNA helicase RhpA n=1 Tax=Cryomorpha ignava TaxID=101383 RepID=A0A7K3WP80_9FLAO|nr:DEAD/DEAH box helicase [Cryomorpha ignava]NEN22682.1 DEAD/DEAH box helicase [Cryomorpha ignava]
MTFKSLGLTDNLIKAVSDIGYTEPSPIQVKAIPLVLERKDILASAQTGTGKTAGFALPMIQILERGQTMRNRPIRALILTPTRELAAQVQDDIVNYSKQSDIRSTVIFGGVNQNPQANRLRAGIDILVATPGRLLDLQNQGLLSLAKVEILVLDEADRMLDMGFLRDIQRILKLLPERRQNLLFSATFSKDIKKLANTFLHHPVLVEATPENTTVEIINQKVYRIDKAKKTDFTIELIKDGNWQQVLIFTRTKHGANRLSEKLDKADISSAAIHGNKSQNARTKALAGFKAGEIRVLVATDIAARGLDIPLLPHVINYEMPNVPEDYVHRIGRTGRAGAGGDAISLVNFDEVEFLRSIEKLIGERMPAEIVEGYEPGPNQEPTKGASQNRGRSARPQGNKPQGQNKNRGKSKRY